MGEDNMSTALTEEQKFRMHHYNEMAKLLRAMKEHYGEEAYEVFVKHKGENVYNEWKEIAEKNKSNSIQDLIKLLWEPLREHGFEYDVEECENGFKATCTHCSLYELAKHLGITEEGFYMFCETDPYITKGFNENIELSRTKTLMQGHDCCDFFYCIKEQ